MKKKKLNDKMATILADLIKKCYEEYLLKSENKTTSDIREDAFIQGLVQGLEISTRAKDLLAELESA